MNNKPLTKEADTKKQLILKNITTIRPIPNEYILKAMDEYARQEAIEFKKWGDDKYWSDYFHDDGHTKLENAPYWSSDSVSPEYLTTDQLYEKYIESKTREKEK